jgi:hypothetical protein
MRSVVEVSPRGSAKRRQIVDDEVNMDLSKRYESKPVEESGGVPSPFMKLGNKEKKERKTNPTSYAMELAEQGGELPETGQIAIFDNSSIVTEGERAVIDKERLAKEKQEDDAAILCGLTSINSMGRSMTYAESLECRPFNAQEQREKKIEDRRISQIPRGYENYDEDPRTITQWIYDQEGVGNDPFIPSSTPMTTFRGGRGQHDRGHDGYRRFHRRFGGNSSSSSRVKRGEFRR